MGGAFSMHGRNEKCTCSSLVGEPERKRTLGSLRCRWDGNIRMVLREIRWGDVNWMFLGQGTDKWRAIMNTVMNFRVA
jgi:hypothetical protein